MINYELDEWDKWPSSGGPWDMGRAAKKRAPRSGAQPGGAARDEKEGAEKPPSASPRRPRRGRSRSKPS